ncbi:hypothetical protein HYS00_04090 [Candidatus Microgenomates bacterium]|nr:hypothetical protein [Candidatus Microgenomates bacterium]
MGAGAAHAQSPTLPATHKPLYASLIDKLAKTFNLDRAKVETVVDTWHNEHKTERMQHMEQELDDRLSQAVKDGKITEAQKTAIIKKLTDEKANFKPTDFKTMTPAQRKDAINKKRTELQDWAKSQGIDPTVLKDYGMGRRGGGFKHGM